MQPLLGKAQAGPGLSRWTCALSPRVAAAGWPRGGPGRTRHTAASAAVKQRQLSCLFSLHLPLLCVAQLGGREEDQAHCESFALAVFNRADRVDRAGRADKATAVTFYAASYFFEVSWASTSCLVAVQVLADWQANWSSCLCHRHWLVVICADPLPMPCSAALSPQPWPC